MPSPAEEVVGIYQRHAEAWDNARSRSLFERAWLDRFADLLPAAARILDIGCGGGEPMARHLINSGYQVTGVDASEAMIELCRKRFPHQDWQVSDMRGLSLGRRFDGLLAWDSFFHLNPDDQRRMFATFRWNAAAEAVLLFTSGPARGESLGRLEDEPLYHSSLDAAEHRRLLSEHGFDVLDHQVEDPTCGGHTIWLARLRQCRFGAF